MIWESDGNYAQTVPYIIMMFYLTPLRTYTATCLSLIYCFFFLIASILIRFGNLRPHACKNDGWEFKCVVEDEEVSNFERLQLMMEPFSVTFFTVVLGTYISYKREEVLRKNFKTVQTSICQTNIMRLATERNQTMLESMLPSEMIEKFKSQDSSVVVDTYADVTVLFCIIDDFITVARR